MKQLQSQIGHAEQLQHITGLQRDVTKGASSARLPIEMRIRLCRRQRIV